jgi:hypothetical protein
MTDEEFEGQRLKAFELQDSASAVTTEIIVGEDAIYKQVSFTYERPTN